MHWVATVGVLSSRLNGVALSTCEGGQYVAILRAARYSTTTTMVDRDEPAPQHSRARVRHRLVSGRRSLIRFVSRDGDPAQADELGRRLDCNCGQFVDP